MAPRIDFVRSTIIRDRRRSTPTLAGVVPAMVIAITILEIAAGALSAIGCAVIFFTRDSTVAFYGAVISAVAIIALFFGQRLAKDYVGAAVLVPYFLLALSAIYLLAQR